MFFETAMNHNVLLILVLIFADDVVLAKYLTTDFLLLFDETGHAFVQMSLHGGENYTFQSNIFHTYIACMAVDVTKEGLTIYYSTIQGELLGIMLIDEDGFLEKKVVLDYIKIFTKAPSEDSIFFVDKNVGLMSVTLMNRGPKIIKIYQKNFNGPVAYNRGLVFVGSKFGNKIEITGLFPGNLSVLYQFSVEFAPYKFWVDVEKNEMYLASANEIFRVELNKSGNRSANDIEPIFSQSIRNIGMQHHVDIALGSEKIYLVNSSNKIYSISRRTNELKIYLLAREPRKFTRVLIVESAIPEINIRVKKRVHGRATRNDSSTSTDLVLLLTFYWSIFNKFCLEMTLRNSLFSL